MTKKKSEVAATLDNVKVTRHKIADYVPDTNNANKGTERGLQMIERGLNKVGVGRSIVVDAKGNIVAGNKTMEAAQLAGIEEMIEIETTGDAIVVHKRVDWDLDDPKGPAREYAYLDNRASEVGLNWDANAIVRDLANGVDLSNLFTQPEIGYIVNVDTGEEYRYSRKIDIPLYEPSPNRPAISTLYDDSYATQLIAETDASAEISDDEKMFLRLAAQRHIVFNYSKIADLYAHGSPALQRLMENSALVIIDMNRAIELGYVKLTQQIGELLDEENEANDG